MPSEVLDFDIFFMKICEDQAITSYFPPASHYTIDIYVGEEGKSIELIPMLGEPDLFFDINNAPSLSALHICGEVELRLDYLYKEGDPSNKSGSEIVRLGRNERTDIVSGWSRNDEDDGLHLLNVVHIAESPTGVVVTKETELDLTVYSAETLANLRSEIPPLEILYSNHTACSKAVRIGESVHVKQ